MHRQRRWTGIMLGAVVALSTIFPVGVSAQGDVGESMCSLFTRRQVRQALGTRRHVQEPRGVLCEWSSNNPRDREIYLTLGWSDFTLDQLKTVIAASGSEDTVTDLTIGGRPALYRGSPGLGRLDLELDPGVLELELKDFENTEWQPVLTELGELAVTRADRLVPKPRDEALLALFPDTVGDAPLITRPDYLARFDGDETRERLLASALEDLGKTPADVSMVKSDDVDRSLSIDAMRVAGADAADFQQLAVAFANVPEAMTVPDVIPNGEVGFIPSGGTNVWMVYPKDDIVWNINVPAEHAAGVLAALPGAPVPPPIPTPAPTPTPDLSTPEGYFNSLLPDTLGGEDLSVAVVTGEEATAGPTQEAIKAAIEAQGTTVDDWSVVAAGNSKVTTLNGFRIAGGDASAFLDLAEKLMRSAGVVAKDAKLQAAELAGKQLQTLETSYGMAYVYPSADVVWVVIADEPVVTELITALP